MKKEKNKSYILNIDSTLFNSYKSIVALNGETIKNNLCSYIKNVIEYNTPNPNLVEAISEVHSLIDDGMEGYTFEQMKKRLGA